MTLQHNPLDYIIMIVPQDRNWWCGITMDGDFKYGGAYKPDEAAQLFWDKVMELAKKVKETPND